jgi:hypothetical protein
MLRHIDEKKPSHQNIKDAAGVLKLLCFVPFLNTGFSLLVVGSWLWGFMFPNRNNPGPPK